MPEINNTSSEPLAFNMRIINTKTSDSENTLDEFLTKKRKEHLEKMFENSPSLLEYCMEQTNTKQSNPKDALGIKNIRVFDTGATRDTDKDKRDYEGFLSPIVLQKYADYLHKHRVQSDGNYRDSDNWQKGIPKDTYIKSAFRHFMDWWLEHRGHKSREGIEDALMGLIFNVMGYAFEYYKELDYLEDNKEAKKSIDMGSCQDTCKFHHTQCCDSCYDYSNWSKL